MIFRSYIKAIREVTSDELQALAQKYFCKENLIAVVAGKKCNDFIFSLQKTLILNIQIKRKR